MGMEKVGAVGKLEAQGISRPKEVGKGTGLPPVPRMALRKVRGRLVWPGCGGGVGTG